jgi:hypothetical protein
MTEEFIILGVIVLLGVIGTTLFHSVYELGFKRGMALGELRGQQQAAMEAVQLEDIKYFEKKLAMCATPASRERIEKQLALMKDSFIISRINSPTTK